MASIDYHSFKAREKYKVSRDLLDPLFISHPNRLQPLFRSIKID